MADKLIRINNENAVMASQITRIERGCYGDVFVWADGVNTLCYRATAKPTIRPRRALSMRLTRR